MSGEAAAMTNNVALLRGVNVGGRKLLMENLRAVATGIGWTGVATYIASGNLLFQATGAARDLAATLEVAVADTVGMAVEVVVLAQADMAQVLADCPFAQETGNLVHAMFCWRAPTIDTATFEALRVPGEELVVRGTVVWLHAPSGIGRSVLMSRIGKVIVGTQMTARNLNTVRTLAARLSAMS